MAGQCPACCVKHYPHAGKQEDLNDTKITGIYE